MPRKKAADRTGPVKTRSRGGCSECRASRVRCDTKKPVCSRCQEKGLTCSTQLVLKWESEFTSRGLAFGRAGVWGKKSGPSEHVPASLRHNEYEWQPIPEVGSWGFVNSMLGTFERPFEVDVVAFDGSDIVVRGKDGDSPTRHQLAVLSASGFTGLAKSLSLFPSLAHSNHGHLFEYYLQEVCPRTTASSSMQSPFASAIVPFCVAASPALFSAIQALGACYWSRTNPSFSAVALHMKSESIRGLRSRLSVSTPQETSRDPEILVIMMMLCLYELVDHCDQRWTIHLKGANDLIRLRRQHQQHQHQHQQQVVLSSDGTDPVAALAEQFFAFQDVMGRTACGKEVLFGKDYWQEDDHTIDLWMGCSPELVSILASITDLSRNRRRMVSDPSQAAFSLRTATLRAQLEGLVQHIDHEDANLQTTAELKRLAAILYLHCALSNAAPSTPLVASYVRRILKLVSNLLDSGSPVSLTWPVFVAAVELDPLNDEIWADSNGAGVYGRPLVLRALASMSESSVSSVARTRAVIVKVWQARDNDTISGSPRGVSDGPLTCNDWEWYVAPISNAMSLA